MAAPKYLKLSATGTQVQVTASTAGGSGNEEKIVCTDAAGRFPSSMMPLNVGAVLATFPTSENLAIGDIVNLYDVTGTTTARKASAADDTKPACGFVLAATTSPAVATVFYGGKITGLSGLTPTARMFLSPTTAGAVSASIPSGAGEVIQCVGTAISATEVNYAPETAILIEA